MLPTPFGLSPDEPITCQLEADDSLFNANDVYREGGIPIWIIPKNICDIKKIQDIEVTREWYEYLDKKMIQDCDMGICVWTGDNKRVLHMIQLMNIYNKPVYTFTL